MMLRVLVVDDAPFMRERLKEIIESAGHEVVDVASDGASAIEKFLELAPDVVTLDITMPVMDGVEALRRIVNLDPDACVVMCSAMGDDAVVTEAILMGAADFVVKPFQGSRVVDVIERAAALAATEV